MASTVTVRGMNQEIIRNCLKGREQVSKTDLAALTGPEERVYESRGYTLRVTFTEGSAQVTASDCPTQDCVHTGAITRSGQSIVCLPARLIVELEGTGDTDGPDVVIG